MNKYIQKNTNTFGKSLQKYSKNNTNKKKGNLATNLSSKINLETSPPE